MKLDDFLKRIAVAWFIILILIMVNLLIRTNDAALKLKEYCRPTEMYVIGNKRYIGRVYDCSKVNGKQR